MKKLLIESMVIHKQGTALCESTSGGRGYIAENVGGKLIVKLPVTILDEKNENGRTYSRMVMEGSVSKCTEAFANKELLSTVDGHPNEPYVEPGNASHVVTEAWVEGKTLYNTWEILETHKGKDLRALIEAGVSFGVSIRGLGSQDNFGNILEDYEYLGTDGVGQPSARIRTRPEVVDPNKGRSFQESTSSRGQTDMKKFAGEFRTGLQALKESSDPIAVTQRLIELETSLNSAVGLPVTEAYALAQELNEAKADVRARMSPEARTTLTESVAAKDGENAKLMAQLQENTKITRRLFTSAKGMKEKLEAGAKLVEALQAELLHSTNLYETALRSSVTLAAKYRTVVGRLAESELSRKVAIQEAALMLGRPRDMKAVGLKVESRRRGRKFLPASGIKESENISTPEGNVTISAGDTVTAVLGYAGNTKVEITVKEAGGGYIVGTNPRGESIEIEVADVVAVNGKALPEGAGGWGLREAAPGGTFQVGQEVQEVEPMGNFKPGATLYVVAVDADGMVGVNPDKGAGPDDQYTLYDEPSNFKAVTNETAPPVPSKQPQVPGSDNLGFDGGMIGENRRFNVKPGGTKAPVTESKQQPTKTVKSIQPGDTSGPVSLSESLATTQRRAPNTVSAANKSRETLIPGFR